MQTVSLAANVALEARVLARTRRLLREPLLHFALIGAFIFVLAHRLESARTAAQSQIVIDDALVERLAQLQATQTGVRPNQPQLATILEGYLDDEVLFREALRMGLDQDDEIIRRRLIQKLQFLQQDVAIERPSEARLRDYFAAHREQFVQPARVSFQHVYFSADRDGDAAAHRRAIRARAAIGGESVPEGDVFPLNDALEYLTRVDATRLFGATDLVDALFTAPQGAWSQPVRSGYGWHLLYVAQRTEPHANDYDASKDEVRTAYLRDAAAQAQRRGLDALRQRYQIVRNSEGATP